MPSSAGLEFTSVFITTDNSSFTDITREMQSPAGTATAVLGGTSHFLYLGYEDRFDLATFDVAAAGGLGELTWEYSTAGGTGFTQFQPMSGALKKDPDDDKKHMAYDFASDGAELFPVHLMSNWVESTVNSVANKYWVRVSSATSVASAPTLYRIQMRPLAAYCSTQDVFELLQLKNIWSTSSSTVYDFSSTTTPSKKAVESYIEAAQAMIDYKTRKSWRPNYVVDEYHDFNINGFKLLKYHPYNIISLQIWNRASWEDKSSGRKSDYLVVPEYGMIHFSRFFLLPARFASYNAPVWRWGGGEFNVPVRVSYLAGHDVRTDIREGGLVFDAARKQAAVEVLRSSDFGQVAVSGMDRVQMAQKVDGWTSEINEHVDSLRGWEIF